MEVQPSVSIIMPVYNQEKYLEASLKCICNQTLKNIEIICVDDGSTDRTNEILQKYALNDKRFKIINQKNQYAGAARNNGMKYARGKYWIFLDSDDLFDMSMLEKMYHRAEETAADILICEYNYLQNSTEKIINRDFSFEESFLPSQSVFSGLDLKDNALFQISVGCAWDKLFRAEFIKRSGYQYLNLKVFEDAFFVNILLAKAKRICFMKEPLISYRIHNVDSLSNKKDIYWDDVFEMLGLLQDELKFQGLYHLYERSFLNLLVDFEIFNLDSLKSIESYKKCYKKIKEQIDLNDKILASDQNSYFYNIYTLEKYKKIIRLEFESFLFEEFQRCQMSSKKNALKGWVFPYEKVEKGKKVVLYGAGAIGSDYYEQLGYTNYCKELYWVDKKFEKLKKDGRPVNPPSMIKKIKPDYVVVAILDEVIQKEVDDELVEMGIDPKQIIHISK